MTGVKIAILPDGQSPTVALTQTCSMTVGHKAKDAEINAKLFASNDERKNFEKLSTMSNFVLLTSFMYEAESYFVSS